MICINNLTASYLAALDRWFGDRVWFVGLQGSFSRGEATEDSDVDMVVILDELREEDLAVYREMLDTLPHREKLCGFLSGREELTRWEPSDLLQLYYDTTPIRGSLEEVRPLLDRAAVRRAIKLGACNIYHGCVHNSLYGRSENVLRGLYKSASFVVQAICLMQTGQYFRCMADLRENLSTDEREIVDTFLHLKNGGGADLDAMSRRLLAWVKKWTIL